MNAEILSSMEVCRYAEADWAPGKGIAEFRWAWRVVTANGNTITGVCNGTKAEAKHKANQTAMRMRKLFKGEYVGRALRASKAV